MLPYRDSRFTILGLCVFFVLALAYGAYEAHGMISGPSISIQSSIVDTTSEYILVKGTTARISSLSMNGMPIPVTESGEFSQPYLLAPGYNRIVLDAADSYGRKTEKVLEIVYTPSATSSSSTTTPAASSTEPIATSTASSSAVAPGY